MDNINNECFKKTPLYDEHVKRGGKIVEFGGYLLPVEYTSITNEHMMVRENCGLFDVSHMGEVFVTGPDSTKYLNYLLTSNVEKQTNNRMQYGMALYEDGTIVDDLMIYKYNDEKYLIVVNASNTDKDYNWFVKNISNYNVKVENKSDSFSQLALQGPKAYEILNKLSDYDFDNMKFYDFKDVIIDGKEFICSRSGYTGGDGFEIYGKPSDIVSLFITLASLNVTLCGLGCRDTLRFEGSLPLYGHEISDQINPLMACLSFACDFSKDFIGKDSLLKYKENPTQKLVGLELIDKGIARAGYEVLNENEEIIGSVTTGYLLPGHEKALALAMIKYEYSQLNTIVYIRVRKKLLKAIVRDRKFMEKIYKK